ncbi:MAG: lamin tail domain-containing protein, partial [Roseiflexaceae bacterium]
MPVRSHRVISLLLVVCGIALFVHPAVALSSSPTVLINEFMAGPNSTSIEWVELFNANSVAVNVSGWKIDNSVLGGTQMVFPAGSLIQSNSLLVITRTGNILVISDTVQLLDTDNNVINQRMYSNAASGKSFARMPDGGISWQQGGTAQYIPLHTQGI